MELESKAGVFTFPTSSPLRTGNSPFVFGKPLALRIVDVNPAPGVGKYGDYLYDLRSGKFNKSWTSWRDFEGFLANEQDRLSIEFRKVKTETGKHLFVERMCYLCSRGYTGGHKVYKKKHPDRKRKVEKKFTYCECSIIVKSYHGTETILGKYRPEHNHPVGRENIKFTRISRETRNWIAGKVRGMVSTDHIVSTGSQFRGVCL